MNRSNLVLAALAGIQLVILLTLKLIGGDAPTTTEEHAKLADFDPESIAGIEIDDPASKRTVKLERKEGKWLLASAAGYPARTERIVHEHVAGEKEGEHSHLGTGLLDKLVAVELGRPVIRQAKSHEAVRVADDHYALRAVLTDDKGTEKLRIYVAPGGNGRRVYVRRAGEDLVYETEGLSTSDLATYPTSWIDTSYVDLPMDEIHSFTVKLGGEGGGDFAFERREEPKAGAEAPKPAEDGKEPEKPAAEAQPQTESVWYLVGEPPKKLDRSKVEEFLRKVTHLSLSDVAGTGEPPAGSGLEAPAFVLTLKRKDKDDLILSLGGKDEKGSDVYAKASTSPYYVKVASWAIGGVLDLKIADLEEKPPAPEVPTVDDAGAKPPVENPEPIK